MNNLGIDDFDCAARYSFVEKGRGAFRTDLMEAIEVICKNIATDLKGEVWGKVNAHYNRYTDVLEVVISNRALNAEDFRYPYYNFADAMKTGISSEVITRFVMKEHHDYLDMFFFRKY